MTGREEIEAGRRTWATTLEQAKQEFRAQTAAAYPVEGPWDGLAYWDPLPAARELSRSIYGQHELDVGVGRWKDRSRINVPGPFYAGVTDDGLNGPYYLPELVLLSDLRHECVFRQPANLREVAALILIAGGEPFGGYACDGDQHWTPESVRQWWADRAFVRDWIAAELADAGSDNEPEALHAYAAYLDDGLEDHLRGYLFWLIEGREPRIGERLPNV